MNNTQRAEFDTFSAIMATLFAVLVTLVLLFVWWPLGVLVGGVLYLGRLAHKREQREAAQAAEAHARPDLHTILDRNAYDMAERSIPPHMRRKPYTWPATEHRPPTPLVWVDEVGGWRPPAPRPRPTPLDDGEGF